ncbi:uncharacterized protein M421DRAFT_158275 [Didymella exigua CBS 183.55]|uniref:Uncharacterized protein n=1 Tax=Didymella exigua CBS 183.55 TaxID=1150837 RepID=A0A6A5RIW1_9PLEO|nr:uncharacterized protein M421DRAFT_158275 [Didymella exigua CBS 183.55]KAF1928305.1 hypothetical protein M421DRAFT_158275 [Didymella exigua CBS 183.55]
MPAINKLETKAPTRSHPHASTCILTKVNCLVLPLHIWLSLNATATVSLTHLHPHDHCAPLHENLAVLAAFPVFVFWSLHNGFARIGGEA